jgi:myo-inositol catabolism protein IolS
MKTTQLGETGLQISRIGFGCAPMGGYDYGTISDKDSTAAVRRALDLGITFFDTADIYGFGRAERVLSIALGRNRKDVVIATKFGLVRDRKGNIAKDCSPKRVVAALEGSLRRLRLDVIPLYQVHWIDPATPLEDTIGALMRCQQQGKIKYLGLSNVGRSIVERAEKRVRVDSVQSSYNLMNRTAEQELLPHCHASDIAFIAHSPLARGFLAGKYQIGSVFNGNDTRSKSTYFSMEMAGEKRDILEEAKRLSVRYNRSVSQVALRWILDNSSVTACIVGIKTAIQVEEIAGAVDWSLEPADHKRLSMKSEVFTRSSLY